MGGKEGARKELCVLEAVRNRPASTVETGKGTAVGSGGGKKAAGLIHVEAWYNGKEMRKLGALFREEIGMGQGAVVDSE